MKEKEKEKENLNKLSLKSIAISGFKSFDGEEHVIRFGDITVLIGANGAGKSNVVSFFKMLGLMAAGALQQYVGEQGFANSLLHCGAKKTPAIKAKLEFENETYSYQYEFALEHTATDSLVFTREIVSVIDKSNAERKEKLVLQAWDKESRLDNALDDRANIPFKTTHHAIHVTPAIPVIPGLLEGFKVYQFHDTSSASRIRTSGYINEHELASDGGNLAAFLYGLKENENTKPHYEKIVRHIAQVFPQFGDFDLKPAARNDNYIMLDWREKNNEYKFGAHQISDGTLRFMALAALLLQPPQSLPPVIILDEPELGLHPTAIAALAGMAKDASQHAQVVLATQSPSLLDEFRADQVIVVERDPIARSSLFKKHSAEELKVWLADYALSEIWDKNILGGNP